MDNTGGVSTGLYRSLNCGLGSDDDRAAVEENRRRVARTVTGRDIPLITPYQVHGVRAVMVDQARGDGARPEADAMVSASPDVLIGVLTADCCPILFEDSMCGLVGVAHAGWKGAATGIIESTVDLMVQKGAKISRLKAAIGPTIAQNSYEVRTDMRSAVLTEDAEAEPYFIAGKGAGVFQFDLPGYVAKRLASCGLQAVEDVGIDTYQSPRHFSYRRACHKREKDYGRFVSVIRAGDPG